MKKLLLLSLSALILAACSSVRTPSSPSSATPPTLISKFWKGPTQSGGFRPGGPSEDFEAQVDRDLGKLERGSGLSAQAAVPFVYLNVLKSSSSANTVRAYFKTNHVGPVVCTVDWGDNSASDSTLRVPTLGRIETRNHTYASPGVYTVTAGCGDGKISSITVLVGATLIDFEKPLLNEEMPISLLSEFDSGGYTLSSSGCGCFFKPLSTLRPQNDESAYPVVHYSPLYFEITDSPAPPSQGLGTFDPFSPIVLERNDGAPFSLKRFDFSAGFAFEGEVSFEVYGLQRDGDAVSATLTPLPGINPFKTQLMGAEWSDLLWVAFDPLGENILLLDNILVSP